MKCLDFDEEKAEVLNRGAEAIIYKFGERVVKFRKRKTYRIKEIDLPLIKYRTRREARILEKLNKQGFPCPKLIDVDEERGCIVMQFIQGAKLKDVLSKNNYKVFMKKAGVLLGKLHSMNIIHDDLTTSNFIVSDKLYIIDFGLSFVSQKIEDKAVDIHLFKRALESKHSNFWEEAFNTFLYAYKETYNEAEQVIKRLNDKVEKRGRYKRKRKHDLD